ncbi:sensor histidine kinase [Sphingomonas crusticola]|uniref:sensor histidine kinase n=1 Tax=Sphingomonas crusticola TaxID=1697973 RepID=UPI000E286DDC|nr:ATP-binding protein [Sphingomonas crusticola]
MGFERNFAVGFGWRLLLLLAAIAGFALSWWQPGLGAARLLAALLVVGATWSLWYYIGRTNREIARFVEGLRYGDFNQGFGRTAGGGFDELGQALGDAMRQLRAERAQASDEARVHAALADEAPSALLLIDQDSRVTLANKAARKTFYRLAGTRVEDFAPYGAEFVALLHAGGEAGFRKVTPLRIDGVVQRAMVSRAALDRLGRPLAIVAVQPIQQELSAVELAAQADLVRVLTHEIMNSMTPVVSLAESAARLMGEVAHGDPTIDDARMAVETLARRASGIMHFVESYRAFSRVPVVERRRFAAAPWAQELVRLFAASDAGRNVPLDVAVEPEDLTIDADPDLLAQVAINLLKNGAEAARDHGATPRVALAIGLLPGGRTLITVRDNGPGIAPGLADEIFLPFFTTKAGGTGVGLSLARRILTAHGGTIALGPTGNGACFEIVI